MKNLVIIPDTNNSALVKIRYEGGGEAPDALKGLWTNSTTAKQAIAEWLAGNPEREIEVKVKQEEDEKKLQESTRK
jgi:hypothetical protein